MRFCRSCWTQAGNFQGVLRVFHVDCVLDASGELHVAVPLELVLGANVPTGSGVGQFGYVPTG